MTKKQPKLLSFSTNGMLSQNQRTFGANPLIGYQWNLSIAKIWKYDLNVTQTGMDISACLENNKIQQYLWDSDTYLDPCYLTQCVY